MPFVSKILLYPIKSLDGIEVAEATVLPSGALQSDREWALFDDRGRLINGKGTPLVHQLRVTYDLSQGLVWLGTEVKEFRLGPDRASMEHWLSEFFGFRVHLRQNCETGFPDDLDSPGPTLIGQESLRQVGTWFPAIPPDQQLGQMRRRFRSNLEIADAPAFWEDQLFGNATTTIPFRIGAIQVEGVNPCQRCPVPSRDPFTGEVIPGFQATFSQQRQATLPPAVNRSRFNHFYRLAVNTRIPATQYGKILQVGAEVVH